MSIGDAFWEARSTGLESAFSKIKMINPQADLLCYSDWFRSLHRTSFWDTPHTLWAYPAPSALLYRYLYLAAGSPHAKTMIILTYALTTFALLTPVLFLAGKAFHKAGLTAGWAFACISASALFSWPIYFAIERGNIEIFLWLGMAAGIYAYYYGRFTTAAMILGVVAAFKIYPLLCFALFLQPLRWRQIATGAVAMTLTTIVGLRFLGPTISLGAVNTANGVSEFVATYSGRLDSLANGYDHSLFGLVKVFCYFSGKSIPAYLHRYTLVAGACALILFFAKGIKMPRLNQVMMLVIATVTLPATSFDYTLQSLYIPWAWLCCLIIGAHRQKRSYPGAMAALVCFALILGPETFLQYRHILFSGQFKAGCLLALLAVCLRYPFADVQNTPRLETMNVI